MNISLCHSREECCHDHEDMYRFTPQFKVEVDDLIVNIEERLKDQEILDHISFFKKSWEKCKETEYPEKEMKLLERSIVNMSLYFNLLLKLRSF